MSEERVEQMGDRSGQPQATPRRATIYDVAARAEVSIATVSLALADHKRIPKKTRRRIGKVAQELGYIPHGPARALASRKTGVVGLVVSDNSNPFFAQIVRGAENCVQANNHSLLLTNSDEDPEREMECVELLVSRGVDGIVLTPTMTSAEPLDLIRSRGLPFVLVSRHMDDERCDYVVSDNVKAGRLATGHLLEQGHRRIAHIMGPSRLSCARERLAGYRVELKKADIDFDENLVLECDWRGGALDGPVEKLWGVPDPPTAVFTYNDLLAFECIAHLRKRGVRVPEDVAVVGHDDTHFATLSNPPLTTVAQDGSELGKRAVEFLLMREQGRATATPAHVVLEPHLVVRESCGKRPGSRPASARGEACAPHAVCAQPVPE